MKKIVYIIDVARNKLHVIPNLFRDLVLIKRSRNKFGMTSLLILLLVPSFVHAYFFTQTMTIGSVSEDVYQLQKILNTDIQTQLTSFGTGSAGYETTYFGELTRQAVIKLQNLHADEILKPVGLNFATGYVGPSTLAFLNKNQTTLNPLKAPEEPGQITSTATTKEDPVQIEKKKATSTPEFFISKQTIQPKEIIYVGSETKLVDIDFFVDSYKMDKSCKHSDYTCAFRVSLDPGEYTVSTSKPSLGSYTLTILDKTEKAPSVSNTVIYLNKENIIKGNNFTDEVKIFTMYGVFESKTKNNSFILKFPENYVKNAELTEGLFYIQNSNGLTSKVKNVTYEK